MSERQVGEVLDLLRRIKAKHDANELAVPWGIYIAVEEEIEALAQVLDAMEAGV